MMDISWQEGFLIRVRVEVGTATVSANREGLLSLAAQLAALAEQPAGSHIHLDEYNALEVGSNELIIEKTKSSSA